MIDKKALYEFCFGNALATKFFTQIAKRKRNASTSTVDQITRLVATPKYQVIPLLKELQSLGLGRFVVGRGGYESRFDWDVKMIKAAEAALEMEDDDEGADDWDLDDDVIESMDLDEGLLEEGVLRHSFHLRKGEEPVALSLPANLTVAEAARLARFIKSLPYDAEAEPFDA